MILLTSLAPSHHNSDQQLEAVKSWQELGVPIFSFNTKEEIGKLTEYKDYVSFHKVDSDKESIYLKPYPSLDSIFRFIKEYPSDEIFMLINSDIILDIPKDTLEALKKLSKEELHLIQRWNFDNNKQRTTLHFNGIDIFLLSKKVVEIYPESDFVIGQCHFDYWLPYHAIKSGVKVNFIKNKIAFHKKHYSDQYDSGNWHKTASHLVDITGLSEFKDNRTLWRVNDMVFKEIIAKSKSITI